VFGYDYQDRRIEKKVSTYDPNDRSAVGGWVLRKDRKFVWSNWLRLLELDGMPTRNNAVIGHNTWRLNSVGPSWGAGAADHRAGPAFPAPGAV
jgi:hypothetical protein